MRAFVSHGKSDSVLSVGMSTNLAAELERADHDVELIIFEGDHTIPLHVVQSLGAFLAAAATGDP